MEAAGSTANPSQMGTYTRVFTRSDRPVYKNANKYYLYYWEKTKQWMIGARVVSRSISPQWGPIRFRPIICTYAPWGVRVDELAKSRIVPP